VFLAMWGVENWGCTSSAGADRLTALIERVRVRQQRARTNAFYDRLEWGKTDLKQMLLCGKNDAALNFMNSLENWSQCARH
jgi:hypothetical protein